MCGCSQTKKPAAGKPASTLSSSGNFQSDLFKTEGGATSQMVMIEYVGTMAGSFSIRSRADRNVIYRFGNSPGHQVKTVFLADAEYQVGQAGADGKSAYRIITTGGAQVVNDPAAFLGQPIVASE